MGRETLTDEQLLTEYYGCNNEALSRRSLDQMSLEDQTSLEGRHHDRMYKSAIYRLRMWGVQAAETLAEDALQETWIRVIKTKHSPSTRWKKERGPVKPWLNTILFRQCATAARRQGTEPAAFGGDGEDENSPVLLKEESAATPEEDALSKERQERIEKALKKLPSCVEALPPRQREVFCMKHTDGMQQNVIATELGIGEGAVANRLKAARENLKQCLGEFADVLT